MDFYFIKKTSSCHRPLEVLLFFGQNILFGLRAGHTKSKGALLLHTFSSDWKAYTNIKISSCDLNTCGRKCCYFSVPRADFSRLLSLLFTLFFCALLCHVYGFYVGSVIPASVWCNFKSNKCCLLFLYQASKHMVYGVYENVIGALEEVEGREIKMQNQRKLQRSNIKYADQSMRSNLDVCII